MPSSSLATSTRLTNVCPRAASPASQEGFLRVEKAGLEGEQGPPPPRP